jgi:hypothetical protein
MYVTESHHIVLIKFSPIKIYGRCLWINRNLLYHFSFYLYCVQTSNFATWSGLNFKTNIKVVLFKRENLIKTIWWLSVTYIAHLDICFEIESTSSSKIRCLYTI